jgi:hypothetical protein
MQVVNLPGNTRYAAGIWAAPPVPALKDHIDKTLGKCLFDNLFGGRLFGTRTTFALWADLL